MKKNIYKHRLFGRTRGRSNKKIDIQNYYKKLEQYKFQKLNLDYNYILDIGSGHGETTIFLAERYKKNIIISCEKYIDGNLRLIEKINKNNINNIKIYPGNVYDIIDKINLNKCFDFIWIFFPDPWPKKKHFKRRLVNSSFLEKMYYLLKHKGKIYIASDSSSYIKFILENIYKSKKFFNWINQNETHLDVLDYFEVYTKYYKKAIIAERKPLLLILEKI